MVSSFTDFTTTCAPTCEPRNVLKVTTPKGVYDKKMIKELYGQVTDQVGNEYLVLIVPDDVNLEIII